MFLNTLIMALGASTMCAGGLEIDDTERLVVAGPWGDQDGYVEIRATGTGYEGSGPGWTLDVPADVSRFGAGLCVGDGRTAALPTESGVIMVDLETGSHEKVVTRAVLAAPVATRGCDFAWITDDGDAFLYDDAGTLTPLGSAVQASPDPNEQPIGLTMFATDDHVYVGDTLGTITRIDPDTGDMEAQDVGAMVMPTAARSPDHSRVWFADRDGDLYVWDASEPSPELLASSRAPNATGVTVWPAVGLVMVSTDGRLFTWDGVDLGFGQQLGVKPIGAPHVADFDGDGALDLGLRLDDATFGVFRPDGSMRRTPTEDARSPFSLLVQPHQTTILEIHISKRADRGAHIDLLDASTTELYVSDVILSAGLQIATPIQDTRSGAYVWRVGPDPVVDPEPDPDAIPMPGLPGVLEEDDGWQPPIARPPVGEVLESPEFHTIDRTPEFDPGDETEWIELDEPPRGLMLSGTSRCSSVAPSAPLGAPFALLALTLLGLVGLRRSR